MFKYLDKHVHYTGSLPIDFIWRRLVNISHFDSQQVEFLWNELFGRINFKDVRSGNKKVLGYFQEELNSIFSKTGFKENLKKFFKIYLLLQNITKSNFAEERWNLYSKGAYGIAKKMYQDSVKDFEIIAGPLLDKSQTKLRLEAMILGLERFEEISGLKNYGKIRLTFIRDDKNKFRNVTPNSLQFLFHLLETEKKIIKRISGFDFSGEENPEKNLELFSYIDQIHEFNDYRENKGIDPFPISVHSGEDLVNFAPATYLWFFNRLLKKKVSSVGHGTFLWIPANLLDLTFSEDRARRELLEEFAESGVEFEICPTANLMMTPLESYTQIPISGFEKIGLKYSINSDNKTIFSTNSKKEHQNVLN